MCRTSLRNTSVGPIMEGWARHQCGFAEEVRHNETEWNTKSSQDATWPSPQRLHRPEQEMAGPADPCTRTSQTEVIWPQTCVITYLGCVGVCREPDRGVQPTRPGRGCHPCTQGALRHPASMNTGGPGPGLGCDSYGIMRLSQTAGRLDRPGGGSKWQTL